MNRVGECYHSFLYDNLEKYQYIKDQDGFNMSFVKIPNSDKFLFYIRMLGVIPAYFGKEIIPGFTDENKTYLENTLDPKMFKKLKFGKNFFWGNWGNNSTIDNIIFFVGWYKDGNIIIDKKIKPLAYTNLPVFIDGRKSGQYVFTDIRMFRHGGKIICYDSYITSMYEIKIHQNEILTLMRKVNNPLFNKYRFYFHHSFCNNIKEDDKNWAYVNTTEIEGIKYWRFLNWFQNGALTQSLIPMNVLTKECLKLPLINMKKDKIDGLNEEGLGSFSFGTPFLDITHLIKNNSSTITYSGIAAGHLKLNRMNEFSHPGIKKFIDDIEKKLPKYENYIPHNSYYYLTYLMNLIGYNNGTYELIFSNAFLLFPTENKYKFSINFPMGIEIDSDREKNVLISMGIGDYYNYIMNINISTFTNLCVHNLEHFNKDDFKCKLIIIS